MRTCPLNEPLRRIYIAGCGFGSVVQNVPTIAAPNSAQAHIPVDEVSVLPGTAGVPRVVTASRRFVPVCPYTTRVDRSGIGAMPSSSQTAADFVRDPDVVHFDLPGVSGRLPWSEGEGDADWVGAWRMAVRHSLEPVGLIELPSARVVELSPAAAVLLGASPSGGDTLHLMGLVRERHHAAVATHALSIGAIDAFHARRRFRRPDGSVAEVTVACRAIRRPGHPDLALYVLSEPSPPPAREGCAASLDGCSMPVYSGPALGLTLGPGWRVIDVEGATGAFLGHCTDDLVGTSIFEDVYPTDLPRLLLALAEAMSGAEPSLEVRLRHRHDGWRRVQASVTSLAAERGPWFLLRLQQGDEQPHSNPESRVRELERHLLRIAQEVQVAGLLLPQCHAPTIPALPRLADLSQRQREILVCLVNGYRVPRIADELYLSPSTVRNHLSAIFKKFGVHSQDELLRSLAGQEAAPLTA
jgi:DNA-binding CsgD family transcriptional regulator